MTLESEKKRIFLVGGPGGVGKTTLAAALGIGLARRNQKTLILTVDPARRLAQALGLKGFSNEIQNVSVPGIPEGILQATMLDSEHYFDKVIERFSTSSKQREKILSNQIYRTMVESLGGSHEYAAMERLLEFSNNNEYEKIVVDTPPTQNALDLLNAPQRLADFMDNSVLKWFQKRTAFRFVQQGTRLAMKAMQKILGGEFLEKLAEVLGDLDGMQAGFRNRNLEVVKLLQSPSTSFLLVTQASEARFLESVEFHQALRERGIPLGAIILNRLEPPCVMPSVKLKAPEEEWLQAVVSYYSTLHDTQEYWVNQFQKKLLLPTLRVARQEILPNDIESLSILADSLVS